MPKMKPLVLILGLFIPFITQATQLWSGCQTVTGVANYIANANQVILALSPGLPCIGPNAVPGSVSFGVGNFGVTAGNLSSFLASGLTAQATGQQVMIYYDSASCFGLIIANGGYAGQC